MALRSMPAAALDLAGALPDLPVRDLRAVGAVIVEFFVAGQVAAKGNMRPFTFKGGDGRTHVRMVEGLRKTKPWLACVTSAAHDAMKLRPLFEGVPLHVMVVFGFPRPKSHFGAKGLKPTAPIAPTSPPDLDKLQRAIGDALKGVVYDDDSRIVRWSPVKVFVPHGTPTGALVRIEPAAALDVAVAERRYWEAATKGPVDAIERADEPEDAFGTF